RCAGSNTPALKLLFLMIEFNALRLTAPDGSIIGVIEEGPGAAWADDPLPDRPCNAVLQHPLSRADAVTKARAISRFVELRRAGATLVLISHDEPLLERCADEIWWLRGGQLVARGDPAEILPLYRRHVAIALRNSGAGQRATLAPVLRHGDGRAALESIELLGENGEPSTVWRSGETVAIRVKVRYDAEVADPVIGILIRTRIGLNVYGTNTELENLHPGPLRAGDRLRVTYRFRCDLCPGDYTITAASHDPDGVWHDWQEDAVAFAVADSRYTAGVANLRAQVYAEVTA
ncbi:MAG: Wzt carbohydrate-binding domain-containing protein, partial [Acidobacteriota bacterium]